MRQIRRLHKPLRSRVAAQRRQGLGFGFHGDRPLLGASGVIADSITPNALLLFNASFASTNELEVAEIARQIVTALRERGIRLCSVTYLYAFAHDLFDEGRADTLFLRAERNEDSTRTFRLVQGEPLETSKGVDLYREVFEGTVAEAVSETAADDAGLPPS